MGRVADLMRLGRVHTAMATAAVPGLACHLAGGAPITVLMVALGAFLHHAWGFSLNEVMDLDLDRKVKELSDKPLVSGRVGRREAVLFSSFCLFSSFFLFVGASFVSRVGMVLPICLLALSTLSGALYDVFGKRFTLSDVLVALWMLLLVLASGAVGGSLTLPVLALGVMSAAHVLFNNSVEGGLKDVENDRDSGVPTLAAVTGCTGRGGKLKVTGPLFIWAVLLRGAYITMASVFAYLLSYDAPLGSGFVILVSICGIALFSHSLLFLRGGDSKGRKGLLRTFAVHEIASFALSLLVVLPKAGIIAAAAAFLLPLMWFVTVNRLMFGPGLSPRV